MKPSPGRLLVIALTLLAAATFRGFPVSRTQLEANKLRWEAMDEVGRESMRRTWRSFSALPLAEQQTLRRRLATLTRLERQHTQRTGTTATAQQLKQLLEELTPRFMSRAPSALSAPVPTVREHAESRIEAFLDSLVEDGRLTLEQRPRRDELSWNEFVQHSLELRKDEELRLAERGHAALTGGEALDPLDVMDRLREHRRKVGYLGRTARLLPPLTDEDKDAFAAMPSEQLFRTIKRRLAGRIQSLLQERSVAQERIDEILRLPPRRQERLLDSLLNVD